MYTTGIYIESFLCLLGALLIIGGMVLSFWCFDKINGNNPGRSFFFYITYFVLFIFSLFLLYVPLCNFLH